MTVSRFVQTLREQVLVADGAMGSMLHIDAEPGFVCTDEVNLRQPGCVLNVHIRHLRAGARLIETNTFGANRIKLDRLGLRDQLVQINQRGVKLAREAREIAGVDAFIGGSIGPSGLRIRPSAEQEALLLEVFREQAATLDERGVDVFVLETFSSFWEIERAVEAVRACSSLPIMAQMTLPAGDDWFEHDEAHFDEDAQRILEALPRLNTEVIGLNCTLGPGQILPALRRLRSLAPDRLLSVQPNSGLPHRVDGRFVYPATSADYYGRFARDAADAGARVIGGCCGTFPEQIRAMAQALHQHIPEHSTIEVVAPASARETHGQDASKPSGLAARFAAGEFVVSMQVDPPKGTRTDMVVRACEAFRDSGRVHVVDVNSNPMARLHMDALWMSAQIEAAGIETIAHYTPRDASLMGIQGNLLGAWNFGVRNVLVITGDPSMVGGEPGTADVYQTDSIGMVRMIRQLNEGRDCFGHAIGSPPDFHIGVAVNPNHHDLDLEIDRFKRKIDAGARFAMTQVFFEWSCWERFLDRFGGRCPIPTMVAVWPLTSHQLAARLHNEVPGIVVPSSVLERLERAGPQAREEGFSIARTMLREAPHYAQGAYVIAPFKRPRAALELFD
jgi:methionine synthase I (cobalamin-dependent)/5,10-methylenetetrahydrofolate reductase